MAMNELSDFDAVSDEPLERQFPSSILAGSAQGLARATLVPLHHREVPLPRPDDRREDAAGRSRAAVDHEQDRVVSILAANPDPLVGGIAQWTGLSRSSPRIPIHGSMPPILTKRSSATPWSQRIRSAAAVLRWHSFR